MPQPSQAELGKGWLQQQASKFAPGGMYYQPGTRLLPTATSTAAGNLGNLYGLRSARIAPRAKATPPAPAPAAAAAAPAPAQVPDYPSVAPAAAATGAPAAAPANIPNLGQYVNTYQTAWPTQPGDDPGVQGALAQMGLTLDQAQQQYLNANTLIADAFLASGQPSLGAGSAYDPNGTGPGSANAARVLAAHQSYPWAASASSGIYTSPTGQVTYLTPDAYRAYLATAGSGNAYTAPTGLGGTRLPGGGRLGGSQITLPNQREYTGPAYQTLSGQWSVLSGDQNLQSPTQGYGIPYYYESTGTPGG